VADWRETMVQYGRKHNISAMQWMDDSLLYETLRKINPSIPKPNEPIPETKPKPQLIKRRVSK